MGYDLVLLRLHEITKVFPGVVALDRVSLTLEEGTIHGLLGENGSGKSTLIKIIGGIYRPDKGKIYLNDKEVKFNSPFDSQVAGISVLNQEIILAPNLSVMENIFLGMEKEFSKNGIIDFSLMKKKSLELLVNFEYQLDPLKTVGSLQPWEARLVQILQALARKSVILALDEPTSAFTGDYSKRLFTIMQKLKEKKVTIIFVTHKIDEAIQICDSITVLRDGRVIGTVQSSDVSITQLIKMMTGREVKLVKPRENKISTNSPILEIKNVKTKYLQNISLKLYPGEILGLVGPFGSGRSEIIRAIVGLDKIESGKIVLHNTEIKIESMSLAKKLGIAYITEERKKSLVLNKSIRENISLPSLKRLSKIGLFVQKTKESLVTRKWIKDLSIVAKSPEQLVSNLSGGNQQKVVIAKWLETKPRIILCEEPTIGVDIASRAEIHEIFKRLSSQGISIIISTSDLDEAIAICDRILVTKDGKIMAEFITKEAEKHLIAQAMFGGGF